jgi:hypothetical protein
VTSTPGDSRKRNDAEEPTPDPPVKEKNEASPIPEVKQPPESALPARPSKPPEKPAKRERGNKPFDWGVFHDFANTALTLVTFVVAAMAYCAEFRGPELNVTVGRQLFLYSKPYVGVMVTIHNAGGNAGSIVRGALSWDHQPPMSLT